MLKDSKVPKEDKEKISDLLQKPWNPYVRRHSSLTEKSRIFKFHTFHQHAGWTPGSNMHLKYTHYFGNESSEELLESHGIETNKDKKQLTDALLRPKQCPNCSESNIPDSKFCSKCRMVLTYDAFSETLEIEKQKDDKIAALEKKIDELQNLTAIKTSRFDEIDEKIRLLNKKLGLSTSSIITNSIEHQSPIQTAPATVQTTTAPTTTPSSSSTKSDEPISKDGTQSSQTATRL